MNRFILTLSCPDRLGIVAKITTFLSQHQAFILEMAQFGDVSTKRFFLRIVFEYQSAPLEPFATHFQQVAHELKLDWQLHDAGFKPRVLLLVSTQSHCLNDLLHRSQSGTLPIEVAAVASNHNDLRQMTEWYKIPFHHWPVTPETKKEQEAKILSLVKEMQIDLVVLARYMQILSPELTRQLAGKAINIHHSFLPSFKGAKPYHQAFDRGVKLIGATAHYVSDELDEGPIIEQEVLRVDHMQTSAQLVELGRDIECIVLSRAIKYHSEQRVFLNGHKTVIFK